MPLYKEKYFPHERQEDETYDIRYIPPERLHELTKGRTLEEIKILDEQFGEALAQEKALSEFKKKFSEQIQEEPTIPEPEFDPKGFGYDYETAKRYGLTRDETGRLPSRVPGTGQILKGRLHPTWQKTIEGEKELGNIVEKDESGRYISRPMNIREKLLHKEGFSHLLPQGTEDSQEIAESMRDDYMRSLVGMTPDSDARESARVFFKSALGAIPSLALYAYPTVLSGGVNPDQLKENLYNVLANSKDSPFAYKAKTDETIEETFARLEKESTRWNFLGEKEEVLERTRLAQFAGQLLGTLPLGLAAAAPALLTTSAGASRKAISLAIASAVENLPLDIVHAINDGDSTLFQRFTDLLLRQFVAFGAGGSIGAVTGLVSKRFREPTQELPKLTVEQTKIAESAKKQEAEVRNDLDKTKKDLEEQQRVNEEAKKDSEAREATEGEPGAAIIRETEVEIANKRKERVLEQEVSRLEHSLKELVAIKDEANRRVGEAEESQRQPTKASLEEIKQEIGKIAPDESRKILDQIQRDSVRGDLGQWKGEELDYETYSGLVSRGAFDEFTSGNVKPDVRKHFKAFVKIAEDPAGAESLFATSPLITYARNPQKYLSFFHEAYKRLDTEPGNLARLLDEGLKENPKLDVHDHIALGIGLQVSKQKLSNVIKEIKGLDTLSPAQERSFFEAQAMMGAFSNAYMNAGSTAGRILRFRQETPDLKSLECLNIFRLKVLKDLSPSERKNALASLENVLSQDIKKSVDFFNVLPKQRGSLTLDSIYNAENIAMTSGMGTVFDALTTGVLHVGKETFVMKPLKASIDLALWAGTLGKRERIHKFSQVFGRVIGLGYGLRRGLASALHTFRSGNTSMPFSRDWKSRMDIDTGGKLPSNLENSMRKLNGLFAADQFIQNLVLYTETSDLAVRNWTDLLSGRGWRKLGEKSASQKAQYKVLEAALGVRREGPEALSDFQKFKKLLDEEAAESKDPALISLSKAMEDIEDFKGLDAGLTNTVTSLTAETLNAAIADIEFVIRSDTPKGKAIRDEIFKKMKEFTHMEDSRVRDIALSFRNFRPFGAIKVHKDIENIKSGPRRDIEKTKKALKGTRPFRYVFRFATAVSSILKYRHKLFFGPAYLGKELIKDSVGMFTRASKNIRDIGPPDGIDTATRYAVPAFSTMLWGAVYYLVESDKLVRGIHGGKPTLVEEDITSGEPVYSWRNADGTMTPLGQVIPMDRVHGGVIRAMMDFIYAWKLSRGGGLDEEDKTERAWESVVRAVKTLYLDDLWVDDMSNLFGTLERILEGTFPESPEQAERLGARAKEEGTGFVAEKAIKIVPRLLIQTPSLYGEGGTRKRIDDLGLWNAIKSRVNIPFTSMPPNRNILGKEIPVTQEGTFPADFWAELTFGKGKGGRTVNVGDEHLDPVVSALRYYRVSPRRFRMPLGGKMQPTANETVFFRDNYEKTSGRYLERRIQRAIDQWGEPEDSYVSLGRVGHQRTRELENIISNSRSDFNRFMRVMEYKEEVYGSDIDFNSKDVSSGKIDDFRTALDDNGFKLGGSGTDGALGIGSDTLTATAIKISEEDEPYEYSQGLFSKIADVTRRGLEAGGNGLEPEILGNELGKMEETLTDLDYKLNASVQAGDNEELDELYSKKTFLEGVEKELFKNAMISAILRGDQKRQRFLENDYFRRQRLIDGSPSEILASVLEARRRLDVRLEEDIKSSPSERDELKEIHKEDVARADASIEKYIQHVNVLREGLTALPVVDRNALTRLAHDELKRDHAFWSVSFTQTKPNERGFSRPLFQR